MDVIELILFLDKLFRDSREFDAIVFDAGEMGLDVNILCQIWKIERRDKI